MDLAPIVLFVYNRPLHTRQTLDALAKNKLADKSTLYIYADGPKINASENDLNRIEEVRKVIREKNWCKEVFIIERDNNKGLSKSIIEGISEIFLVSEKIIVLEDDLLSSNGFLEFMNDALTWYKGKGIAGVSGWSFNIPVQEDNYFSRIGSCWGWATWKDVWINTTFDTRSLLEKLKLDPLRKEFNADGVFDYYRMLEAHTSGVVDSWAIRFYANYFIERKLFLFPKHSLIANIGKDGTGIHEQVRSRQEGKFDPLAKVKVDRALIIREDPRIRELIISSDLYSKPKKFELFSNRLMSIIKRFILNPQ